MRRIGLPDTQFIFLIIAICAGLVFVKITPPFWGVDESTHFLRAYEVSQGHVISKKIDANNYGDYVPANLSNLVIANSKLLTNRTGGSIWQRSDYSGQNPKDKQNYLNLENSKLSSSTKLTAFSGSAAYSPISYVAPAIAIDAGKILNLNIKTLIRMARTSILLVWALCVFSAIILVSGRKKWIVFAVALLPMEVFQASIVNPDGIINGLAILYLGLYLRAVEIGAKGKRLSARMITALTLTLIVLALAKPVYFILGLTIIFLPAKLFARRKFSPLLWKALLLLAIIIPVLIWSLISAPIAQTLGSPLGIQSYHQVNAAAQVKYIFLHPISALATFFRSLVVNADVYIISTIGVLGWNFIGAPLYLVIYAILFLALVTIYAARDKNLPIRQSYVLLAAGLLTILAVFLVLYMTFNPVGAHKIEGVQGRYFLPALPFLLVALSKIMPFELRTSETAMRRFCVSSSVIILIIASIYYSVGTY